MTNAIFNTWETSRKLYTGFFDQYSLEQLNTIPSGFNNNVIWNIGHVIAAQQSLIYRLSGLEMHISPSLFDLYKPGTKPTKPVDQSEADELKYLLTSLIEKTKADFNDGKFVSFTERTTGTGFHLANLTDAFEFNNYHEGLHLGMMMSIKKFI